MSAIRNGNTTQPTKQAWMRRSQKRRTNRGVADEEGWKEGIRDDNQRRAHTVGQRHTCESQIPCVQQTKPTLSITMNTSKVSKMACTILNQKNKFGRKLGAGACRALEKMFRVYKITLRLDFYISDIGSGVTTLEEIPFLKEPAP